MYVNVLVEGVLDEIVASRLLSVTGHEVGARYGKRGAGYIKSRIDGFNRAAQGGYILALVDFMDTRLRCPPEVVENWLPQRHPNMLLRVVVNEVESWLLSDGSNIARFLGVRRSSVPMDPEQLRDPKRSLVNLAQGSRHKKVRELIAPPIGSAATEGPAYTSELGKFVMTSWDVEFARRVSPSLDRCLTKLESI